jgi:hypothetical protein
VSTAPHHGRVTSNFGQSRGYTVKAASSSPRVRRLRICATTRNPNRRELVTGASTGNGFATGPVSSSYAHGARRSCISVHCRIRWRWRRQPISSPSRSMLDGLSSALFCSGALVANLAHTDSAAQAGPIIRLCARLIFPNQPRRSQPFPRCVALRPNRISRSFPKNSGSSQGLKKPSRPTRIPRSPHRNVALLFGSPGI